MAAKKNTRSSRDRNLWEGAEFEDMNSDSSGAQQQDFFAEFARNHAASAARGASSPEQRPRRSQPRRSGGRESGRERSREPARGTGRGSARDSARERGRGAARDGRGTESRSTRPSERRSREPVPRKRRKPMSLLKRRLLIVLALAVMLGGTLFLAESLLLRVTEVRITGDAIYAGEDVRAVCDYHTGDNLLLIPRKDREQKLELQLPYIAKAKISIRIPGTVEVHLTAAQPICAISAGGGWYVTAQDGKVLEVRADPPEGLAQVTGLTLHSAQPGLPLGIEGEEQAAAFREIVETIGELGAAGEFTRLDMSDMNSIRLWYQDRVECLLGTATDLKHKIVYGRGVFDTSQKDAIQPDQTGTLDLSYLSESNRAFFNPGPVSPGSPSATPQPPDVQAPQNGQPEEGGGQEGETPESTESPESQGGRGADIPDQIYTGG